MSRRVNDALEQLATELEAFWPELVRLAMRVLNDRAAAEDAAQEALIKAFVAVREGEVIREPRAWARVVTAHEALHQLRRRQRFARLRERIGVVWPGAAPSSPALHAEVSEATSWARALPESQRIALWLKDVEGWSTREIANAFATTDGAIEQRLQRARSAIRAKHEQD